MNIVEAVQRGVGGERFKREDGEWLILKSDKTIRYLSNSKAFSPTTADILATNWIAENDFIVVSQKQIKDVLTFLSPEDINQILTKLGFSHLS